MTGSVKSLSVAAVLMRSMPAPKASVGTNVFATCAGWSPREWFDRKTAQPK